MLQPQWLADLSEGACQARRAPAGGTSADAHRDGLPVLDRRDGRSTGARAAVGRGDAEPADTTSASWRPPRRTSSCLITWSPAAKRSRFPTTVQWHDYGRPGRPRRVRRWIAQGDFECYTCTNPTRPACRSGPCWSPKVRSSRPSTPRPRSRWRVGSSRGILRPLAREDRRPHRGVGRGPALADRGARFGRGGDPQRGGRRARSPCAPLLAGYPRPGKTVLFLGRLR